MGFARLGLKLKVEQEERRRRKKRVRGRYVQHVICLCVVPSETRLKQSQACNKHLM